MKAITIQIENTLFCIPSNQIQMIISFPEKITKLPLTKEYVLGLTKLRDDVIIILSLNKILNIIESTKSNKIILIGENKKGFSADKVLEVIEISEDDIEELSIGGENKKIIKRNEQIYSFLDLTNIL